MPRKTTLLDLADADFLSMLNSSFASGATAKDDIRTLVELYYDLVEMRKASANRIRKSIEHATAGSQLLKAFQDTIERGLEKKLVLLMDQWTDLFPEAVWAKGQKGVGPILAAALSAFIDVSRAPTVGHIWRFAGLDPSVVHYTTDAAAKEVIKAALGDVRGKLTEDQVRRVADSIKRKPETLLRFATTEEGEITVSTLVSSLKRRPWNARLKSIVWMIGDSAKKNSVSITASGKKREPSYYGLVYRQRKAFEVERNLRGENAETAASVLSSGKTLSPNQKRFLNKGLLPDGQIDLRAMRYATKLFLAHWHEHAYRAHFNAEPPNPYAIAQLEHVHYIPPPPAEAKV